MVEKQQYQRVLKLDDDAYLNMKRFRLMTNDYAGMPVPPHDGDLYFGE